MKFQVALLALVSVASACGDGTFRCKNPDKSVAEEHEATMRICNKLEAGTCWCYHWAEDYCDLGNEDKIEEFKRRCYAQGENWYANEC